MPTDRDYGVAPPRYRLPDATRIGRIRLQVNDLDRSIPYYRDVLGFHAIGADGDNALLASHASDEPLMELCQGTGVRPIPRSGLLGLYHFAILLPTREDLGRFVQHLGTLGVAFSSADHFVSEAIYLWDPDGLGIEVYADRPRDAWHANGRELVMTTERLDLRSLVNAGGSKPWAGMPSGTTMGHLHLSVSDLEKARDFYHVALGFDVVVWSYPGALFMSVKGYHHQLGTNTWAAGARVPVDEEARLLEWELVLPELKEVKRAALSLQNAGYDIERAGDDRIVIDPWGVVLRLKEDSRLRRSFDSALRAL